MQETLPKRLLFLAAAAIVAVTMMYTQHLAGIIRAEEQRKVQLWAEAVKQRAELVTYTQKLFEELGSEERKKADRLGDAYRIIQTSPPGMDLTFISDFLFSNKSVPVLIYNDEGKVLYNVNVAPPPSNVSRQEYFDSLRINVMGKNPPIRFEEVGQTIYYAESLRLTELRKAMADLIESFISETVINSASVPVLLVDSTGTKIVKSQGFDLTLLGDSAALHRKLYDLAKTNLPIPIVLPQGGAHLVFYEESWVLTQLRFFPAVQLLLIAAFLLVAYLVFSSSRRAEQDRVWVGMAKETAHQLGTPLSSLMAWSGLLASRGVDPEALAEMDKDLFRLQTVAERFSKIGSKPDLTMQDPLAVVQETVEYMRPRIGKHVDLVFELGEPQGQIKVSRPLLSWVLENLLRNAVDAMDGQGTLTVRAMWSGDEVHVEVEDTGKGMSKALQRKVFEPGFTTKSRGWGLGLSLAKRIVEEMHRGSIYVARSEPGQGTCFRIVFIP
ncbi:MAG: HAMP domain-containing sensor histidine kinase [Bacteroidetes bacterium]|nr:HAMP domain-containing sensor histidine kinase [Bacteroidota bacterium]MDA0903702.1 HAMP domain-containing sensor histidine kinase [Bacteroidota bacterium]MDA1242478.1 HAMP domain-containing sensor histidine kinase [Bacteroidota bacterium]